MARAGAFSLVISLVALVLTAVVFFHSDFQQGSEVTFGRNLLSGVNEESGRFARKLFAGDEIVAAAKSNNAAFLQRADEATTIDTVALTESHPAASVAASPSKKYVAGVCGATFPGFNFYPAVHHKGDDLKIISHTILPECIEACREEAGCAGIVYSEALASTCWLKSALGSGIPSDVADTFAVCTAASPPPPMDPSLSECSRIIPGFSALHNTDFTGTEISAITGASPESCAKTCQGISTCAGFSFSKQMETCWLRSAVGTMEESHHLDFYKVCSEEVKAAPEESVQAVEAVATQPEQMERGRSLAELCGAEIPGYVHHPSTYFSGADLASYTGETVESCAAKCGSTDGCHGFVWSESISEGTCFLKSQMREGSPFPGVGSYTACNVGAEVEEESGHGRSAKSTSFVASHLNPGFQAVTEAAIPQRKATTTSVCSSTFIYLRIYTEADIYKRLQWSNTTSVHMAFKNSLTLQFSFVADERFACTVIEGRPSNQSGPVTITTTSYVNPPLLVHSTSNVVVRDINWVIPFTAGGYGGSSLCPYVPDMQSWTYVCPTIQVWKSYNVRLLSGSILGRLDLFRVANVKVDSVSINGNVPSSWNNPGAIRTGIIGDPSNLIGANVVIQNNEIYGGGVGVMVAWQTVGLIVKNNYFHSYSFAAIQCGITIHNVADCVNNQFDYNFMTSGSGPGIVSDGTGFYGGGHWTDIGNTLTCNYIVNTTGHCYYFDFFSSGIVVNGGFCQTTDGVKINTGKANQVNYLIQKPSNGLASAISCQNYFQDICGNGGLGQYYIDTLFNNYWTTAWEQVSPWLNTVCDHTSIRWNGVDVPCNPPGAASASVTGACSGMPYSNDINTIVLDNANPKIRYSCNGSVPTVPQMNTQYVYAVPTASLLFNDAHNYDYGIDNKSSPIYQKYPNFKSCPVSQVGPQTPSMIQPITTHSLAFTRAVKRSLNRPFNGGRFGA